MGTCEVWCGLEYRDDAVPVDWPGEENSMPFGVTVGSPSDVRAYCTASCRDRASSKASAPTVERLMEGWKRVDDLEYGKAYVCTDKNGDVAHGRRVSARYINREDDNFPGACDDCAPAMGVFASPVTDDRGGMERAVRKAPEPVVCAHVGRGRTGVHEHDDRGTFRGIIIEEYGAPLPQWLTDERALMQSAPPVQVLPEFPRSRIERDNAHMRPAFQRSPRYVGKGRS
jgi:hypothetical protein